MPVKIENAGRPLKVIFIRRCVRFVQPNLRGGSRMKKLLYVALLAVGVITMIAPPAMAQEEKPFTLHGEVRFRGEYDNNTQDFDKNTDDGGLFWPYRVRIAAEGKFAKNVSAWIEFQNASVAGGDIT